MKREILFVCLTLLIAANVYGQYRPIGLPIGIDTRDVTLAGSKGSKAYNMGVQEGVRLKGNDDATRFLVNAVQENDPERVAKLLNAGASAYVSYEMIDKQQYDIMDLMHQNNPLLIRFSQMLHYACAHSDSTIVDFLIDRGASLDLCGNYWEKYRDSNWGELAINRCRWNQDRNLRNTPLDCALRYGNTKVIEYVKKKYKKYPTVIGMADYLYDLLNSDNYKNNSVEDVISMLMSVNTLLERDVTTEVLNTGVGYIRNSNGEFGYNYLIILAVEKMAEYSEIVSRYKKDHSNYNLRAIKEAEGAEKKLVQYDKLIRFMIDNKADVNVSEQICSILYIGIGNEITWFKSPMSVALKKSGMLDIIRLLKNNGASMNIKARQQGRSGEVPLEQTGIKDEYKELILTGEL